MLAQKVQSDLQAAGSRSISPGSPVATSLNTYRAGTEELGLWYWGPDYPDPNDYLVFLPGQTVGLRAGWAAGSYPALEKLGVKAGSTADPKVRSALYQQIGNDLNAKSPFYPLVQPGQVVASSKQPDENGVQRRLLDRRHRCRFKVSHFDCRSGWGGRASGRPSRSYASSRAGS